MKLEMYEPTTERAGYVPKICITKRGTININKSCVRKFFDKHERVYLYFGKEEKLIGLRPTNDDNKNTFAIHKYTKASMINAVGFFKHHRIFYDESKDFKPEWNEEEKLVLVNLNNPIEDLKEYAKEYNKGNV